MEKDSYQRARSARWRPRLVTSCALAAYLLTTACQDTDVDPEYKRSVSNVVHGPIYDPEWIESRSVYGVQLGDDIETAAAKLRLHGTVTRMGQRPHDRLPWTYLYKASHLSSEGLPPSDMALLRRSLASSHPEIEPAVLLYGTKKGNRTIVTAISLNLDRTVDAAVLGAATEQFDYYVGGYFSGHYRVFAAERGMDVPYRIPAMDGCGVTMISDFEVLATQEKIISALHCRSAAAPSQPYIFVTQATKNTPIQIDLRDPRGLRVLPREN